MTACDLAVLGAGPAGAEAAMTATACGLSVVLLDEQEKAGGQVYRAPAEGTGGDPDTERGERLRARLAASGVRCLFGHRVWNVERGFQIMALGPDGPLTLRATSLIFAGGALERHCPVPGWTLPGVIGLAAATVLLKAHRMPPGRRVVVAGSGPLLPLVAARTAALGGEVVCVVDAARRSDWLGLAPDLLRAPRLASRGAAWLAALARRRVPVLSGHALRRIEGHDGVETVTVGPVGRDWAPTVGEERVFDADAVCMGFGLVPETDVTRLLRAEHDFDAQTGGWTVRADIDGRTGVSRFYVCGDAAGVSGAAAAPHSGRLAALAAARDMDRLDAAAHARRASPERKAWRAASAFGRAMTRHAVPKEGARAWCAPDTVVCRCEGVTRAALEAAVAAGAATFDDVKSSTRCGMGPCGGRVCGEPAAAVVAAAAGTDRAHVGLPTGRSPLRPVGLDDIAGAFDYDSLPFPAPAPL